VSFEACSLWFYYLSGGKKGFALQTDHLSFNVFCMRFIICVIRKMVFKSSHCIRNTVIYLTSAAVAIDSSHMTASDMLTYTNVVSPNHLPVIVASDRP